VVIDMAAHKVALHGARAAVGDVGQLDVRHDCKQLGRDMGARADTGGRIGDFARVLPGQRNQVRDTAHRQRRMNQDNLLIRSDQPDRCEIPHRIVTGIGVERGGDAEHTGMADHQGIAVARSLGDRPCPDGAAGAAAVLDHELLAERPAHVLGNQARQDVIGAPRRKRHHDGDRTRRIDLRGRRLTNEVRRREARDE
jgi:hypothetical protein